MARNRIPPMYVSAEVKDAGTLSAIEHAKQVGRAAREAGKTQVNCSSVPHHLRYLTISAFKGSIAKSEMAA